MPLTVLTTLIGGFVMIGAWYVVAMRMRRSANTPSVQIIYLHRFLLYMGIFFVIMFIPHLWLTIDYSKFPLYMALGYTIGHIFMYIALTNTLRLTFSMLPRIASKERYAVALGIFANIAITAATAITMIYGTRPEYDFAQNVTLFNTASIVGASIAIFAALSVFPAAILMIMNGVRQHTTRTRSFLLGGGLFLIMAAGPLHDTARNAQQYLFADIFSIAGLLILAGGILYRYEERLSMAKSIRTR